MIASCGVIDRIVERMDERDFLWMARTVAVLGCEAYMFKGPRVRRGAGGDEMRSYYRSRITPQVADGKAESFVFVARPSSLIRVRQLVGILRLSGRHHFLPRKRCSRDGE